MYEPKDWLFRIHDMIDHAAKIQSYTRDTSKEDFFADPILQDAVVRNFEIIGEAARFVPKEIQMKYDQIVWEKIIGMRHKISHDYFHVDMDVVWNLIENKFFGLQDQLISLLEQEDK